MITIISGSRTITDYNVVKTAIETSNFTITKIIHGAQPGVYKEHNGKKYFIPTVDLLAQKWASENHISYDGFPAEWKKYGKGAGFKRNKEMAQVGQQLIAVWDGISNGTKDMMEQAYKLQLPIFVWIYNPDNNFNYSFYLKYKDIMPFAVELSVSRSLIENAKIWSELSKL